MQEVSISSVTVAKKLEYEMTHHKYPGSGASCVLKTGDRATDLCHQPRPIILTGFLLITWRVDTKC